MDNRAYYDDFAGWYERERGRGYHQLIDDLEVELVARYGRGADILEAGCGTGLILDRVATFAGSCQGVDLSAGMLQQAAGRGLSVAQGSITDLPFAAESFDVVYSFKVLAHIENIHLALLEMARVTRPGGHVLAEFYNTRSLRYLVKRLKPPTAISDSTRDTAVYTRYDSIDDIRSYLPADLELVTTRGIRIVTPVSHVHRVPGLSSVVRWTEEKLADHRVASRFGGFLVAVLRKRA